MFTIKELLGKKYSDFVEYCIVSEKVYPVDISSSDYVAFRVQYDVSREYVNEIKSKINCGIVAPTDTFQENTRIEQNKEVQDGEVEDSSKNCEKNSVESMTEEVDKKDMEDTEFDKDVEILQKEKDNKIERNKTIPYDLHVPLSTLFGVNNIEKYSNIGIEAINLRPNIERIIKGGQREFVADVLRCSIAQLFDFNCLSRIAVVKIIKQIEAFVAIDVNSIDMKLRRSSVPFYKLFNIESPEEYKDVSVNSITFSTRFTNALSENNIKTLFLLLQLSIDDLQGWKYLGFTSIKEAIAQLGKYFNATDRKIVRISDKCCGNKKTIEKVVAIIDDEIKGDERINKEMDEETRNLYSKVKEGIEICGEEFYTTIRNNSEYAKILIESMREFYTPILEVIEKKNKIIHNYFSIPLEFRSKSAKLLYKVYKLRNRGEVAFLDEIDEQVTLSELVNKVSKDESAEGYCLLEHFFSWITNIDIEQIVEKIFSRDVLIGSYKVDENLKDKYWLVLEMRSEGETLENIGSLTESTRERVRQIEKKYTKQFALYYQNSEYDLLAVIHALRGGDNVLSKSEVQAIIGEKYTNLLWLVLSKELLDCNLYRFSKEYNAVIFVKDNQNSAENLRHVVAELPEIFFAEGMDELIDDLSQKYGVSKELIAVNIRERYTKYGTLYSQSSPTVAFMCRYILKMKFPNGFKTGDKEEANRFNSYLVETFGEKKGKMTARALDAKVGEVGVLCDRGKYIHPDYLHVDKWIIDEINAYIEQNEKTVVTYSEIFDELNVVLSGSQITNRFMLQGALKFYGCKYKLTRDYITKDQGRSLTDEFEDFASEHGEFHKADFFASFPSMTDANLGMLIGRCPNVFSIDNGYYMHSSVLTIVDKDYGDIKKYLDIVCSEGPSNSRYLFEEFSYRFIDFMSRNEISNHTKLFGILNYMFNKEFIFSRPYISKEDVSLTNKEVVLRYLEGVDSITIEDLISMCQERGIRYMSSGYLIRQLSPNFIRISETTLMRYELTGINDDVILEVASYVANRVETNTYCSVATIKDFLWFPTISIEWTSHLVESIVSLSGDMICRINMPTTNMTNLTSIYVCEEFAEDDYVTFVLKIVDSAFEKGFFTSKMEMKEYLSEQGLINNNNLPNFLEGTDYYYINEEGILKRKK